jgi:hypothetical protein
MSKIINLLGLNCEQTQILFSFQYQLVLNDIKSEKNESKLLKKKRWLDHWKSSVEKGICSEQNQNFPLITNYDELKKRTNILLEKSEIHTPYYLILLELVCFTPYFPLLLKNVEDQEFKRLKFYSKKKSFFVT